MENHSDVILSEREIEILRLVATGASNKEIALGLTISPNTVKVHLRNIFAKIGAVSRTEATLYAFKHNIVASPGQDRGSSQDTSSIADSVLFIASPLASTQESKLETSAIKKDSISLWAILLSITALLIVSALTASFVISSQNNNPTPTIQALLPDPPNRWSNQEPLPSGRSAASSATLNGNIYVIGGRDNRNTYTDTLRYETGINEWGQLASKPIPVSDTQAAIIQEKIYIPGGRLADGTPSDVLEAYDIQTDHWQGLKKMPENLYGCGVAAVEGTLYVFGGWDGGQLSDDVWIYNPKIDLWDQGTPLPSPRSGMAIAVVEGRVLLMGGEDAKGPKDEVIIYSPSQDQSGDSPYEIGVSLPQPRSQGEAVQLANLIFIFGGTGIDTGYMPPITLDTGSDQWSSIDQSNEPIGDNPSVTAVGSFVYVLGGQLGDEFTPAHQAYQAFYTITIPLITSNE